MNARIFLFFGFFTLLISPFLHAADRPQWGQYPGRNLVSSETGLPVSFDVESGEGIKWTAKLGNRSYSTPVISGGRILIGTNNGVPRDPKHEGDRGVLMCLDEKDGRFLWQLVVPKWEQNKFMDWPQTGICSTASVEGNRAYLLNNRGEVMCIDMKGLADGNDGPFQDEGKHLVQPGAKPMTVGPLDADIIWVFDLADLGVHQHDAAHCSILIHGSFLYVCTSNGVSDSHFQIPSPDAPGLVVFDKATGRPVAREREGMGQLTIHSTWSSPSIGTVNGKERLFFGGGDGVCYAFETLKKIPPDDAFLTLKKVWSFDCDTDAPKKDIMKWQDNRRQGPSNIYGMPVFHENRVYVTAGGDFWHGKPQAWLKCIDATGKGDVTQSGEVWTYPLNRHCMSTTAVHEGLAYIVDCGKTVHCVDIKTGKAVWTHDGQADIWASPLVADGKVYVGTRRGVLWVFKAGREKEILAKVTVDSPINASPIAANGVLYIASMTQLYAVGK